MAERTEARLWTEPVAQVVSLRRGSDSVELRVGVPDAGRRPTVAGLGIGALGRPRAAVHDVGMPQLETEACRDVRDLRVTSSRANRRTAVGSA
jgi:hypothetical protein